MIVTWREVGFWHFCDMTRWAHRGSFQSGTGHRRPSASWTALRAKLVKEADQDGSDPARVCHTSGPEQDHGGGEDDRQEEANQEATVMRMIFPTILLAPVAGGFLFMCAWIATQ
jgi:hypothetical protein